MRQKNNGSRTQGLLYPHPLPPSSFQGEGELKTQHTPSPLSLQGRGAGGEGRTAEIKPTPHGRHSIWLLLGSALVVIGLVSCVLKAPTPKADRAAAERFVAESRGLFAQKRTQEALEALSKATEADPSWARPHVLRAELLRMTGGIGKGGKSCRPRSV